MAIAQSISRESVRAVKAKDVSYYERHMAPDYTYVSLKGKTQTRADALSGMKGAFASIKGVPGVTSKIVSARMQGAGLLFVEDQEISAKVGDGPKLTTIQSKTRTENLFVNRGGVWMAKRTKVLKDRTVIDGKPMPMN